MPARLLSMDIPDSHTWERNNSPASANSGMDRRRSGRITKKPQNVAPAAFTARDGGSTKRKRGQPKPTAENSDTEERSSGGESVESVNVDSDEETYGETISKRRKGSAPKKAQSRPVPKKSRVAGATKNVLPLRTASTKPASKARRSRKLHSTTEKETEGLYGETA